MLSCHRHFCVILLVCVAALLWSATTHARELRVTVPGDLAPCVSGGTLAAGPDAGITSAPGDTCVLDPGTYPGATVTLPNLTIRSVNGKFNTIIAGIIIAPVADGVTVGGPGGDQGVTLSGSPGAGIDVRASDDFTLQNSDAIGNGAEGILVSAGGGVRNFSFLDFEVRGNTFGMRFANGSFVSDVTVIGATFQSNTADHIRFANGGEVSGFNLRNATLRGAGAAGVVFVGPVTDVRDSDFSNSQIEGNITFGIVFGNAGRVQGIALSSIRCVSNPGGNVFFANGSDVSDVLVEGSEFNRSTAAFGIRFANVGGVESLDVSGSEFDQNGIGFFVTNTGDDFADSTFDGNQFRNNTIHGLFAALTTASIQDLDFSGNRFSENSGVGAFFRTTTGDISGFRFDGDQLSKNGALGLDVITGFGPVAGAGDIGEFTFVGVVISENGAAPGTGARFMTSDGDVQNVDMSNSDVSNNGGFGLQLISTGAAGAPGTVSNVMINNSNFNQNGRRAAVGNGSGIMLNGRTVSSVEISQSNADSNNDHGVDASGNDSLSDLMLNGGSYSGNDSNVDSIGDGIHVNTGAGGTANNVTISDVTASDSSSGVVIAMQGRNGSNLTVQNSQAHRNDDAGIRITGAEDLSDVLVEGNTVDGNPFNIDVSATVNGSNIIIRNNRLMGASGTGVFLNSTGVTITENDIRNHDIGVKAKKATNNHINNNNIARNNQFGVDGRDLGGGQRLDAKNNWWGEPSGPSGSGPGIGDAVSGNVDYQPFLGAPAVTTGANFQINNVSVPAQANAGQTVTITATVANVGNQEGTQDIVVKVTGPGGAVVKEEMRTTPLNPAGSTDITLQVSFDADGVYTVEVSTDNDSVTRTITVGSGGPTPPPSGGGSIEATLDANNNNRIDDTEILVAIALWISGSTVPGTNETISDAKIRELIQMWISGTPIQ